VIVFSLMAGSFKCEFTVKGCSDDVLNTVFADPDVVEVSRENRVKKLIISELSQVLKSIQSTQQARPGEPIYSSDSANHLCHVCEAVFLHGLKTAQKYKPLEVSSLEIMICVSEVRKLCKLLDGAGLQYFLSSFENPDSFILWV